MPPITTTDSYVVGKTKAKLIYATPEYQARIVNNGGGKLFWKLTSDVTTSDTEVASGSSFQIEKVVWVISNSRANITVEHQEAPTVQDMTVNDKATVKGEVEIDGDLNHDGTKVGLLGAAPVVQAAAITSPAAEVAPLKTAVDAIRVALKNVGITA